MLSTITIVELFFMQFVNTSEKMPVSCLYDFSLLECLTIWFAFIKALPIKHSTKMMTGCSSKMYTFQSIGSMKKGQKIKKEINQYLIVLLTVYSAKTGFHWAGYVGYAFCTTRCSSLIMQVCKSSHWYNKIECKLVFILLYWCIYLLQINKKGALPHLVSA